MVYGLLSSFVGLVTVVFFSICVLFSGDLTFFWLFLELSGLCLIPCFFLLVDSFIFSSLFVYIIVSSVSSSLLLFGLLYSEFISFFVLGLLIKFGVFPFFGWIYKVVSSSNWLVVWCFSTFLKLPFFYVCYFLSGCIFSFSLIWILCSLTFFFVGIFFWLWSINWFFCWCHMMVSSSSSFLLMSFVVSLDVLFFVFLVYIIWCSCVICFFWFIGYSRSFPSGYNLAVLFFYIFLLISSPVSLSLFYKMAVSCCIFSCGLVVLLLWVFYSVSEQLYLISNFISGVVPKSMLGFGSLV